MQISNNHFFKNQKKIQNDKQNKGYIFKPSQNSFYGACSKNNCADKVSFGSRKIHIISDFLETYKDSPLFVSVGIRNFEIRSDHASLCKASYKTQNPLAKVKLLSEIPEEINDYISKKNKQIASVSLSWGVSGYYSFLSKKVSEFKGKEIKITPENCKNHAESIKELIEKEYPERNTQIKSIEHIVQTNPHIKFYIAAGNDPQGMDILSLINEKNCHIVSECDSLGKIKNYTSYNSLVTDKEVGELAFLPVISDGILLGFKEAKSDFITMRLKNLDDRSKKLINISNRIVGKKPDEITEEIIKLNFANAQGVKYEYTDKTNSVFFRVNGKGVFVSDIIDNLRSASPKTQIGTSFSAPRLAGKRNVGTDTFPSLK